MPTPRAPSGSRPRRRPRGGSSASTSGRCGRSSAGSAARAPGTRSSTSSRRTAGTSPGRSSAAREPSPWCSGPRCGWCATSRCACWSLLGFPDVATAADAAPLTLGAHPTACEGMDRRLLDRSSAPAASGSPPFPAGAGAPPRRARRRRARRAPVAGGPPRAGRRHAPRAGGRRPGGGSRGLVGARGRGRHRRAHPRRGSGARRVGGRRRPGRVPRVLPAPVRRPARRAPAAGAALRPLRGRLPPRADRLPARRSTGAGRPTAGSSTTPPRWSRPTAGRCRASTATAGPAVGCSGRCTPRARWPCRPGSSGCSTPTACSTRGCSWLRTPPTTRCAGRAGRPYRSVDRRGWRRTRPASTRSRTGAPASASASRRTPPTSCARRTGPPGRRRTPPAAGPGCSRSSPRARPACRGTHRRWPTRSTCASAARPARATAPPGSTWPGCAPRRCTSATPGRRRPRTHLTLGRLPQWADLAARAPRLANLVDPWPARAAGRAGRRDRPPAPACRRSRPAPSSPGAAAAGTAPRPAPRTDRSSSGSTPSPTTSPRRWRSRRSGCSTRAGYEVRVVGEALCCGLTEVSTGRLDRARATLRPTVAALAAAVADGAPLVGLEPSCLTVLRDDALHLLPGSDAARRVAAAARPLAAAAARHPAVGTAGPHRRRGRGPAALPRAREHRVGRRGGAAPRRAGADLTVVRGCCGLAGDWGLVPGHHAVSVAIAEQALLPAVRALGAEGVVCADGFSCRVQVADLAGRRSHHLAEILDDARRHDEPPGRPCHRTRRPPSIHG